MTIKGLCIFYDKALLKIIKIIKYITLKKKMVTWSGK